MSKEYLVAFLLSASVHTGIMMEVPRIWHYPHANVIHALSAIELSLDDERGGDAAEQAHDRNTSNKDRDMSANASYESKQNALVQQKDTVHQRMSEAKNAARGAQWRDVEPCFIYNPPPHYPRDARQAGEQGIVIVDCAIACDGSVRDVLIYQTSGFDLLDRASLEAVSTWRFTPAMQRGRPVGVRRKIPIIFRLE